MHLHKRVIVLLLPAFLPVILLAQQLKITDFVLFGGNGSCPTGQGQKAPLYPGCSVFIGPSSDIKSGAIGSYHLIKSGTNIHIAGDIFSAGSIQLGNNISVNGRIAAANTTKFAGNVIDIGNKASITGNVDAAGNISIGTGGSNVKGKVTHPAGTIYTGPVPAGGNITAMPAIPGMPSMPTINSFPAAGTVNITATRTITPGSYGNVTLTGKQKLTFSGPGVYVFKQIKNTGKKNSFIYDFKNIAKSAIYIYVHGDVDVNIHSAKLLNGGDASRIFLETHGTGATSTNGTYAFTTGNR